MRLTTLVFALLLFCSCGIYSRNMNAQNIYQFKKYDQLERLSQDTLFVVVHTENQDLELLEKYGKSKQAQRIKANIDKRNNSLRAAFENHFTFAPMVFWELKDHNFELPNGFYTNIAIYEMPDSDNGMQSLIELQVNNNEDITVHSVRCAFNPYVLNHKWLVKTLNKDLIRINKRGLKLKQQ